MPVQLTLHNKRARLCLKVKRRIRNEERIRGAVYGSPNGTGNAMGNGTERRESRGRGGRYWGAVFQTWSLQS